MDYRIAVCDDQQEDRQLVQELALEWAKSRGFDVEVRQFSSGDAFLFQYTEDKAWDILLLDVEMPGCSGVELAKQVRRKNKLTQIVFVTGYSDYIAEGYDVSALHYLLKPVNREKLFSVLNRAVERLKRDGRSLLLELPEELVRVPLYQVEYLEVRQNYVTVHTAETAYTVKKTLTAMERELDDRFFRVGRSFILNLSKVQKVTKREAVLLSGETVPLPRGGYDALNRAIIQKL
ncbi:MAG: LytR/AlgR family response regulator transcription factor [Acutalibacter sp.]|jgi:DNA-binding LytR/AlgR family response regulator